VDATLTMMNEYNEASDHMRRLRAMEAARKAFIEAKLSRAIKKALRSKHHSAPLHHELQIGQDVYFFDKRGA